jgi:uncharacterized protein
MTCCPRRRNPCGSRRLKPALGETRKSPAPCCPMRWNSTRTTTLRDSTWPTSASTSATAAAVQLLDEGATVPFIARYRKEVTGGLDDTQLRNCWKNASATCASWKSGAAPCSHHRRTGQADAGTARPTSSTPKPSSAGRPLPAVQAEAPHQGADRARSRAGAAGRRAARRSDADAGTEAPNTCANISNAESWRARHQGGARRRAPDPDGALRRRCRCWKNCAPPQRARHRRSSVVPGKRRRRRCQVPRLVRLPRTAQGHSLAPRAGAAAWAQRRMLRIAWRSKIRKTERADPPAARALRRPWSRAISASATRAARPTAGCSKPRAGLDGEAVAAPRAGPDEPTARARRAEAIRVFARNLNDLLLAAPAGPRVMGLDPGIRTGVKVAVVDATGKLVDTATDLSARAAPRLGRFAARAGRLARSTAWS